MSSKYTLQFDEAGVLATCADGGFDVALADEATAIELFRDWLRRERLARERQEAAERRRARFRVVAKD